MENYFFSENNYLFDQNLSLCKKKKWIANVK